MANKKLLVEVINEWFQNCIEKGYCENVFFKAKLEKALETKEDPLIQSDDDLSNILQQLIVDVDPAQLLKEFNYHFNHAYGYKPIPPSP